MAREGISNKNKQKPRYFLFIWKIQALSKKLKKRVKMILPLTKRIVFFRECKNLASSKAWAKLDRFAVEEESEQLPAMPTPPPCMAKSTPPSMGKSQKMDQKKIKGHTSGIKGAILAKDRPVLKPVTGKGANFTQFLGQEVHHQVLPSSHLASSQLHL